jgi:hypothetical protein
MWTQRHKSQNETCGHNGTKHKAKHVGTAAQSTQQNMWTQRHKAHNKTCEHSGTKHKTKHVNTAAQSTKQNMWTQISNTGLIHITTPNWLTHQ